MKSTSTPVSQQFLKNQIKINERCSTENLLKKCGKEGFTLKIGYEKDKPSIRILAKWAEGKLENMRVGKGEREKLEGAGEREKGRQKRIVIATNKELR